MAPILCFLVFPILTPLLKYGDDVAVGAMTTLTSVMQFAKLLPLIYIMPQLLADKTMAVYTAEPVADVLEVSFTAILFRVQFKKAIRSITDKPVT